MNRIYKVVFDVSTNCYKAVSELGKSQGKGKGLTKKALATSLAITIGVTANASNIQGGTNNTVTGQDNSITAGSLNTISGPTASLIGAGEENTITSSTSSAILTGSHNRVVNGWQDAILNGSNNVIKPAEDDAQIGFTYSNRRYNTIAGGYNTIESSDASSILGGYYNNIKYSTESSVLGGRGNQIISKQLNVANLGGANISSSSIIGGYENVIENQGGEALDSTKVPPLVWASTIAGGQNNHISADNTFIGSGVGNVIGYDDGYSVMKNKDSSQWKRRDSSSSVLLGGEFNTIGAKAAFIGSGQFNKVTGDGGVVVGGGSFESDEDFSNSYRDAIKGIPSNLASGKNTFIGSGTKNTSSGDNAFIGSGQGNIASGDNSFVGGGGGTRAVLINYDEPTPNTEETPYDQILNQFYTKVKQFEQGAMDQQRLDYYLDRAAYVDTLMNRDVGNTASGDGSIVVGGTKNTASGDGSVVVGGGISPKRTTLQSMFTKDEFKTKVQKFFAHYNPTEVIDDAIIDKTYNYLADYGYTIDYTPQGNNASGDNSFVGNGTNNIASGRYTFIGNGQNNKAKGDKASILGGKNNLANGIGSAVIGNNSTSNSSSTIVLGDNSYAGQLSKNDYDKLKDLNNRLSTNYSEADALAYREEVDKISLANSTEPLIGVNSIAIGSKNIAANSNSITIGKENYASGGSTAIGRENKALTQDSIAIGSQTVAGKSADENNIDRAVAIGYSTKALSNNSLALGFDNNVSGESSTAIGLGNTVSGNNSGAIGDPNTVSGTGSYVLGNDNTITQNNTFALGNNITSTQDNTVILGNNSTDTVATTIQSATVGNLNFGGFAGKSTIANGVLAIGSKGAERQIVNVGSGDISATSTDAINGSQLHSVAVVVAKTAQSTVDILGGNATLGSDGTVSFTNIGSTGKNNINDAIMASQSKVASGKNTTVIGTPDPTTGATTYVVNANSASVTGSNAVTVTAGQQDANGNTNYAVDLSDAIKTSLAKAASAISSITGSKNVTATTTGAGVEVALNNDITLGSVTTGGVSISTNGVNAGGKIITNVASGVADSDGVNVGQLNTLSKRVDVADANLQSQITSNNTDIANLSNTKADTTYVNAQNTAQDAVIATKADTTYVDGKNSAQDTVIATKANTTYVDTKNTAQDAVIATKANTTYVDTKNTAQDTVIATKADIAYVKESGANLQSQVMSNGRDITHLAQTKADLGYVDSYNGQQDRRISALDMRIGDIDSSLSAGIASSLSISNAPFVPGKYSYAFALGNFNGETAIGVNLRKTADNGRWSIEGGVSTNTQNEPAFKIGVSGVIN